MKTLFKVFVSLFLLSSLTTASFAQKTMGTSKISGDSRRKALVIGNKAYTHVRALANTGRDVDSVSKVLRGVGFQVFPYLDLNRQGTEKAFSDFLEAISSSPTEVVFVYYTGHGLGLGSTNYLLPIDTRLDCLEQLKGYSSVSLNAIVEAVSKKEIKHNYFFMDACRDLPNFQHCDNTPWDGNVMGMVDPLKITTGAFITFATRYGSVADDNTYDKANSLFTSELIKHLPTPDIDLYEVFKRVKLCVIARSGDTQDPQILHDIREDLILVPTSGPTNANNPNWNPVPLVSKTLEVIAYKPNGKDLDYELGKATVAELKKKYPERVVTLKANGKGLANSATLCTVKRQTTTSSNPFTTNRATYDLIKAETQLTISFQTGGEEIDKIELEEAGTDHQERVAIQNSIERALGKLQSVTVNLD
ncbi:caspase family protein [Persicitalea jodogahamensis]|uniref:Caspase family p20 domain-containing protein n=1 Tax=Persicitalea jodogahamensis TaxID=402147 RepID=A0A8J3D8T0_9BACT|nr:caspase family protein [Persicitalea jodogahamensis]GHB88962.1 hypothetical protein GCM10007390_51370 [Persicitalea jodogahamensis]